jgi:hypothetical protein
MATTTPIPLTIITPSDDHRFAPRDPRMLTVLLVGRLIGPRGDGLCRIRNISAGGLMAETCAPFTAGDAVRIELRGDHSFSGDVRWAESNRIGIRFDRPIPDIKELLTELRATDRGSRIRQEPRSPQLPTDCRVDLRIDGRRYRGTMTDLSQHGARLAADAPLARDQLLTLTIAGLPPLQGVVRWLAEEGVDIAFIEPIGFSMLGAWFENAAQRYNRR